MTIDIITGLFGGLLIFVAIVGGGFELRELKVPKVGGGGRSAAAVVGSVLLFFAFGLAPSPSGGGGGHGTDVATAVDFTIQDGLGDGQITEKVTVEVDDRPVGTLTVDLVHTTASLTVTVDSPGPHTYTLSSQTTFELDDGTTSEVPGYGHGQIDVIEGKSYDVSYTVGDEQLDLVLG